MAEDLFKREHVQHLAALLFLAFFIGNDASLGLVWADTWVCPRPGQADLYTDREYPGCRQLGEAKMYSPVTIFPAPKSSPGGNLSPSVAKNISSDVPPQQQSRKPSPFSDVSLSLPLLSVGQDTVGSITGSWTGFVAQLIVGYKADGKGPEILGDWNLLPASAHSFYTAVVVASRAVGYDPRYLTVRILVPSRLNGPSAGGMFAVGIASALLGDPIRQDVCMSGTIEPDAEIHPVGRLVDKMNACRDLRKTTMIVPDGLDNSHLNFTGAERSIQVIQVHTLAEAYSAATGQALRQVP
ncbi:MAG: S16 family serine protease [Nitrospirota bacterium]